MDMNTKVVILNKFNIEELVIREAASVIREGGTVAFPTETVYGLGANALNPQAVKKIFKAKGRPQDNPLIVHVASHDIENWVKTIPDIAKKMMDAFWPGPLTIIFSKKEIIPDETTSGLPTVGIRMPNNLVALELIKKAGVPIAAPSANTSGKPSPTVVSRVIEDLNGKVDYIIGGDESEHGLESTIIDCTQTPPCILRPGSITLEALRKFDKDIYIDPSVMKEMKPHVVPKAPGMKYKHYAPKAPVTIVSGELSNTIEKIKVLSASFDQHRVGILCSEETKGQYHHGIVLAVGSREDLHTIGHHLFEALRTLDDFGVERIFSESFQEEGVGVAIMNRLKKAASYDVIDV